MHSLSPEADKQHTNITAHHTPYHISHTPHQHSLTPQMVHFPLFANTCVHRNSKQHQTKSGKSMLLDVTDNEWPNKPREYYCHNNTRLSYGKHL